MKKRNYLNYVVHIAALYFVGKLIYSWFFNPFSINPIEDITKITGNAALIFLIITLSATPINYVFKSPVWIKNRRIMGLYSFYFALTHFLIFIALDYILDPTLIINAVIKQPFALIGFTAFLIMTILAITSNKYSKKKLRKKWKTIHRGIYIIAGLVIIHYFWLSKDNLEPLIYSSILVTLLLFRIPKIKSLLKF